MQGFKTFLLGLLVALIYPAIEYLESVKAALASCGIDPDTAQEICGLPTWMGLVIGGLIMLARMVTKTAIFKKDE